MWFIIHDVKEVRDEEVNEHTGGGPGRPHGSLDGLCPDGNADARERQGLVRQAAEGRPEPIEGRYKRHGYRQPSRLSEDGRQ